MEVTNTIKKIMLDKKVKASQIADNSLMTRQNFSRILNSGEHNKIETLVMLADLLDCDVEITLIDRETGKKYNCE